MICLNKVWGGLGRSFIQIHTNWQLVKYVRFSKYLMNLYECGRTNSYELATSIGRTISLHKISKAWNTLCLRLYSINCDWNKSAILKTPDLLIQNSDLCLQGVTHIICFFLSWVCRPAVEACVRTWVWFKKSMCRFFLSLPVVKTWTSCPFDFVL